VNLAGCAVFDDQGRVLLVHRSTADLTQWEMPGGKIEPGEDPSDAAVREIKEELGVDVAITHPLGTSSFDFRGTPCEYHYFRAKLVAGVPAPQEAKHDHCAYTDITVENPAFSRGVKGLKKVLDGQA
jgi:8-oxo-dGTP diphosphatase